MVVVVATAEVEVGVEVERCNKRVQE